MKEYTRAYKKTSPTMRESGKNCTCLLKLNNFRVSTSFLIPLICYIRSLVLGITFLLDRLMYGSWILVPLNFLKFNVLSSGGDFYGTHKWHWYFTQGFSAMLFSFIPFSISGIITSRKWKLTGLIIWVLGIHSLLGHKEFRYRFRGKFVSHY